MRRPAGRGLHNHRGDHGPCDEDEERRYFPSQVGSSQSGGTLRALREIEEQGGQGQTGPRNLPGADRSTRRSRRRSSTPRSRATVDEEIYNEAYVEHDGAKVLIAEILAGTPDDEFYDAKVKVLSEMIKHHVKEEEQRGGMFAQAKDDGDVDLAALGAAMAARKKELAARMKSNGVPKPATRSMKGPRARTRRSGSLAPPSTLSDSEVPMPSAPPKKPAPKSAIPKGSSGIPKGSGIPRGSSTDPKGTPRSGGETHQQVAGGPGRNRLPHDESRHAHFRQPEQPSSRCARTDAAGRLYPSREDLPLRSRANSRAHRPCSRFRRAWLFRMHARDSRADARHGVREEGQAHAGVLPLFHGGGREGFQGHAARCSRLRGQVLLRRGQLGPGRQQYSRVLHPGCDQVPGSRPCGETGGGPRLPAGRVRARHVLGLRVADAGKHAHDHVGDVGPRYPEVACA